jgi:hypothetical protein
VRIPCDPIVINVTYSCRVIPYNRPRTTIGSVTPLVRHLPREQRDGLEDSTAMLVFV